MSSQDGFLPVGVHGIADHIEKTVSDDTFETVFVMPYQNRFPVVRNKKHPIGAYEMLPFRRATAYNSLIA